MVALLFHAQGFFSVPGLPLCLAGSAALHGPNSISKPVKEEHPGPPFSQSTTGRSWDRFARFESPKVKVLDSTFALSVLLVLLDGKVRRWIMLGKQIDIDIEIARVRLDGWVTDR